MEDKEVDAIRMERKQMVVDVLLLLLVHQPTALLNNTMVTFPPKEQSVDERIAYLNDQGLLFERATCTRRACILLF